MGFLRSRAGLMPAFPSPVARSGLVDMITEEAAVQAPTGPDLHVTPLVAEGDRVAKGAAVACLRDAPDVCFVAPIAGRVARISLKPGRRLSEIVLFRDADGDAERHDLAPASDTGGLRRLMQVCGFWPLLRRRPFGGMPPPMEVPAAIFVMAADTRPNAPDPRHALEQREEAFGRGLAALERMTEGPVFVVLSEGSKDLVSRVAGTAIRTITCGARHPQGLAGICIHQAFPAGLAAPVWDVHAEDVAELGDILSTGELPMRRLVPITGAALKEARTVRTHPGADLRQLTQRLVAPGPHVLMSGSQLDGRVSQWLGPRHRQVTVLPREAPQGRPHWLVAALTETAKPKPAIPTAALDQSLGASVPAAPFVRALGAGDEEAAMRLGLLSFLEDDVALADYAVNAGGELRFQLREMLRHVRTEYAA